jgi:ribosomal protein S18 acetylase RimI-like enzyme
MQTKSGKHFDIVTYDDRYFQEVKSLWQEALHSLEGWRAPEIAIPAKTAMQPELFLVAVSGGRIIGTTMAGYDGHRGWLYTVAVLRTFQREGVGSALVRDAERRLLALGCLKINLQVVAGNTSAAAFYEKLGYAIEDRISMSKSVGTFAKEDAS